MECIVNSNSSRFYPILIENNKTKALSDSSIARFLGLTFEEYEDFIIQNGGIRFIYYFFKTKEECQDFIEKVIEPRLIMEELIK